jgi:oligopeptide/dipeptide ABC transporter ATP-binding protein
MTMAGRDSIFEIEGLTVEPRSNLEGEALIEHFDLRLAEGEALGVVGETGAGKSLSMRAAVGLLPGAIHATAGKVTFAGRTMEASAPSELRRNLGQGVCLLLQNGRGALNPFRTVGWQVDRILSYRGLSKQERISTAASLLDAVGLPARNFRGRYPHQLSGGQAQRVAMVIALATEPRLLIADEPTTALDVTTERDVIMLLKRLCRERDMALILITHNLGLVANNCDNVMLMHAGHVVEVGPTREIFERPAHPYAQALLAAIPEIDRRHELVPLAGSVPARGQMGAGCRFVTRCPHAEEICAESVPPLVAANGHLSRCVMHVRGTPSNDLQSVASLP